MNHPSINSRYRFACLAVGAVLAGIFASSGAASLQEEAIKRPTDSQILVHGNNQFAFDLYARLAQKDGNIAFSPYSISTALAMAYGGARGETAAEMAKTLHFQLGQERLHPAFGELAADLQKDAANRPFDLFIANSLWGQTGFPFVPQFLQMTKRNYDGGFREIDFASDPEAARKTINAWVEKQTRDKIKDLLIPGIVTSDTRLVLANALYFKGTWEIPFPKEATKDAEFEVAPTQKVVVPMMSISGKSEGRRFHYGETSDCQWLELPYLGRRISMVIVLPKSKGGLANFEKAMTLETIQKTIKAMNLVEGSVSMPRFKMTKAISLAKDLQGLGINLAFSRGADFQGLTPKGLSISFVEHKAFIEVNEVGTEAAAATAVGFGDGASKLAPFLFRADHPFLYLIRDRQTDSILFLGRVTDPSKS